MLKRRSTFGRSQWERPPRQVPTPPSCWREPVSVGMSQPVPKGIATKPGKVAPTVEERRWMNAAVVHGCIACRMDGHAPRPTTIHHILQGGERMGHLFTLPLCDPGHHQDGASLGLVSRHPWKARFEKRYGTEHELLSRLKVELGFFDRYEVTK